MLLQSTFPMPQYKEMLPHIDSVIESLAVPEHWIRVYRPARPSIRRFGNKLAVGKEHFRRGLQKVDKPRSGNAQN